MGMQNGKIKNHFISSSSKWDNTTVHSSPAWTGDVVVVTWARGLLSTTIVTSGCRLTLVERQRSLGSRPRDDKTWTSGWRNTFWCTVWMESILCLIWRETASRWVKTLFQVPGFGSLVPGSRFQVPGSRFQVPGSRIQVPGSRIQSPFRVTPSKVPMKPNLTKAWSHWSLSLLKQLVFDLQVSDTWWRHKVNSQSSWKIFKV